jgi:hypothetical protein
VAISVSLDVLLGIAGPLVFFGIYLLSSISTAPLGAGEGLAGLPLRRLG